MTRGNYSVEFEFGETGCNPAVVLELDIDYIYTPGQPDKLWPWPGEQGYGPEVDKTAKLRAKVNDTPVELPPAVEAWLLSHIKLDKYDEVIIEQESDN